MAAEVRVSDCLSGMQELDGEIADLVYLDPPFCSQKVHRLSPRDRSQVFSFSDLWTSRDEYASFLANRVKECHRILKNTGSIFFHCDRHSSHIARFVLDRVFGEDQLRAEIIWTYRRWSNSQRTLLPAHQTIYFYSKSDLYKFTTLYEEYSPSTNVDQILQRRRRDLDGKVIYKLDANGIPELNGSKPGVPLGDVWDIPYLNPKAHERVGYPTQKPLALIERILELVTDPNDLVVDPFVGSGTTVVAASILGRNAIGFDISEEAAALTRRRLANPVRSSSELLRRGRDAYATADERAIGLLYGIAITPVQRNKGIDAFLQEGKGTSVIPIRVQRVGESLSAAADALYLAGKGKNATSMVLVVTDTDDDLGLKLSLPTEIHLIRAPSAYIREALSALLTGNSAPDA